MKEKSFRRMRRSECGPSVIRLKGNTIGAPENV